MRTALVALGLLVGILHAGPAVAQAPYAQPAFRSFHATLTWQQSDSAPKRTYWLEGGVIGAVVLGITGYVVENAVASSLCSDTAGEGCHDYRAVSIVGGAALGFLVGALIGRGHIKGP